MNEDVLYGIAPSMIALHAGRRNIVEVLLNESVQSKEK